MTTPSLSIIIINWNGGSQLRDCIASIENFGSRYVMQTIVIDNGSTDGSVHLIENLAEVRVIHAGSNLGFAKACNLGAKYAKSDFLLFFNSDAALYAETLPKAMTFMQDSANSTVGICGVQLVDEQGRVSRSCARDPSVLRFLAPIVGLEHIFPACGHFMAEWDHGQTRKVDHVIGAFFLMRRIVFDDLRGFDERFFVYLEDLDFALRARSFGWSSVYLADVQAFHAGGGSSRQVKAQRLFYSLRSRLLYSSKHFSWAGAALVMCATLLIEPFSRSAFALLRMSRSEMTETWTAYGLLWRWLPSWLFHKVTP